MSVGRCEERRADKAQKEHAGHGVLLALGETGSDFGCQQGVDVAQFEGHLGHGLKKVGHEERLKVLLMKVWAAQLVMVEHKAAYVECNGAQQIAVGKALGRHCQQGGKQRGRSKDGVRSVDIALQGFTFAPQQDSQQVPDKLRLLGVQLQKVVDPENVVLALYDLADQGQVARTLGLEEQRDQTGLRLGGKPGRRRTHQQAFRVGKSEWIGLSDGVRSFFGRRGFSFDRARGDDGLRLGNRGRKSFMAGALSLRPSITLRRR